MGLPWTRWLHVLKYIVTYLPNYTESQLEDEINKNESQCDNKIIYEKRI